MNHIKLKARRKSERDHDGMTFYDYDLKLEVDGVEIENATAMELSWDINKDVPVVKITLIPETIEIDADCEEPG